MQLDSVVVSGVVVAALHVEDWGPNLQLYGCALCFDCKSLWIKVSTKCKRSDSFGECEHSMFL